ncbi:hypothetical protein [Arenicella xantha]|uniref:Lipocalin-like protein n=1 Tax=Arenicella xantha TaxID=644221 RepID=A0A395JVI2_9GAMM|nr:hypothetical protein [Arenicella xantha]RBP53578.1 hypothetical protein DFR28_101965 [Arenicella xantha]
MQLFKRTYSILLLTLSLLSAASVAAEKTILPETEGLWEYTSLVTSKGEDRPLTGIFLIKNGTFLQQSMYKSEPFDQQGSMAHAGTCWAGGAGLRLAADQTLHVYPLAKAPTSKLDSDGATEHDLKVTRNGDNLTLVFSAGAGTVQTLKRVGSGDDMQVYQLADGKLALSDGYFILVSGSPQGSVSGHGKYEQNGKVLTLNAISWSQSDGLNHRNLKDVSFKAFFDGKTLNLPDGKTFNVVD